MNHERLKCYCILIGVAKRVPILVSRLPRGEGFIVEQFKRALGSAILNLAEANGRTSQRERNRFLDISLASMAESASAIDIISAYGYITNELETEIKSNLRMAHAMVRKLKKS